MRMIIPAIVWVCVSGVALASEPVRSLSPMLIMDREYSSSWLLSPTTEPSRHVSFITGLGLWLDTHAMVRFQRGDRWGDAPRVYVSVGDSHHAVQVMDTDACEAAFAFESIDGGERDPPAVLRSRLACPSGAYAWEEHGPSGALRTCAAPMQVDANTHDVITASFELDGPLLHAVSVANPSDSPFPATDYFPCALAALDMPRAWRTAGAEFVRAAGGDAIMVTQTLDGERDGNFYVLYPDGRPAVIGSYLFDREHGLWGWFSPGGALVRASKFVLGVETPLEVTQPPPK